MIIYVHGFASAGQQTKWELLRHAFPDQKVFSPTLPVEPYGTVSLLKALIDSASDGVMLVGTSLGGFYAWHMAALKQIPAIIINPSTVPWISLRPAVGTFDNFVTGEPFEWKEAYLDQLRMLALEKDNHPTHGRLLKFFISTDDELIDHSGIEAKIPPDSEIRYYDCSAHRFTRFPEILPLMRDHYSETC